MSDAAWIRDRLVRLIEATPGEPVTAGYWVGDKAAERRVSDNFQSGRLYWQQAREGAKRGLVAFDSGDIEYAELALRNAEGLRAAAIEAQLKPSQFAPLMRDAETRGRKADISRDQRLAAGVAAQEALGLTGKAARSAAIEADLLISTRN